MNVNRLNSCIWDKLIEYVVPSGACYKVVALDVKKHSDSEHVAFNFRTKKISVNGVDQEILEEVHKFPSPVQRMLIDAVCAVEERMKKGKGAPGLISLDCHCLFRHRYLLPCKHIFHEYMYDTTVYVYIYMYISL